MNLRRVAVVIGLWLAAGSAHALPTVSVDVDPATGGVQDLLSVSGPTQFSVDIRISGAEAAQPLNAFELDLLFDPSVVQALSVSDGDFLLPPLLEVENEVGAASVGFAEATLLPAGASGDGVLASVLFETVGPGTSVLDLTNVLLSAPFGVPIEVAALEDGAVSVGGTGPSVPEPSAALLFAIGSAVVAQRVGRGRRRPVAPLA